MQFTLNQGNQLLAMLRTDGKASQANVLSVRCVLSEGMQAKATAHLTDAIRQQGYELVFDDSANRPGVGHAPHPLGQVLTAPLPVYQVVINGHALCPPLSFARGCDPCRPGTAVQVERPRRSQDERPGRSAVGGTAWRRPPRSRNVPDRRRTDAADPPICVVTLVEKPDVLVALERGFCTPLPTLGSA